MTFKCNMNIYGAFCFLFETQYVLHPFQLKVTFCEYFRRPRSFLHVAEDEDPVQIKETLNFCVNEGRGKHSYGHKFQFL